MDFDRAVELVIADYLVSCDITVAADDLGKQMADDCLTLEEINSWRPQSLELGVSSETLDAYEFLIKHYSR